MSKAKIVLYIALVQGIAATGTSLFYSEILKFTPCVLCWYQRIFMFPLVVVIAVGILRRDKKVYQYVLPLSFIGLAIAFYHVLLQFGVLPESVTPCSVGVSCLTKFTGYFGFITIPVLSFAAFSVITICILLYRKFEK